MSRLFYCVLKVRISIATDTDGHLDPDRDDWIEDDLGIVGEDEVVKMATLRHPKNLGIKYYEVDLS